MKFSTKLLLLYLGFTLGVIMPVCSFLYYAGKQATQQRIKEHLQERAEHFMNKMDRVLFERFADIQLITKNNIFHADNPNNFDITQRLLAIRDHRQVYVSLSFFDANRIRVADTAGLSIGEPASESRWVQDVFEKGVVSVGADIHFDEDLQKNVLFVAAPVEDKTGNFLGAVVGRMAIERIHLLDTLTDDNKHIYVDLIDQNGLLLYSNYNQSPLLKPVVSIEKPLKPQLMALFGQEAFHTITKESGFLNFQGNQWTLIVHYSVSEAFAPLTNLRHQAIMVGFGLLLFAFIGLFWFSRQIIKPVITLKEASLELGKGRLKTRVPVLSSKDEIGQLSIVFNQMADLLDEQMTELKKEQEKFTTVLDSLEAIVYVADMQTYEVLFANQFAKKLTRNDLEGKICWQHLQAGQSGPCTFCSNDRLVDQDGQPTASCTWEHQSTLNNHWYYVQDRAIWWTDGRLVRLTIATNITKRKQAEQALQKSEERFNLALQGANDGLWDWNLQTNKVYHSPRFKEILGFAEHEFSDSPDEYVTRVHPDDVTQLTTTLNRYLNKEISSYEHIHRIQHKEGHYLWVLARATAVWNQQDKPLRIVGTIADITVQKEAEEQLHQTMQQVKQSEQLLKTVINATPDWIFVKDQNYRFLLVNQGFANAVNTKPEQMIGKNDEEVGFPKEQIFGNSERGIQGFRADDQAALSGKTLHNPYDIATFADGTVHIFDTLKMPLQDDFGYIFAMLGFSRDITERTKVEKALLLAKEAAEKTKIEAENANKAKSTFLANMSHELRTPLNGILGYAQILGRDKTLNKKQQEGISIIQRSGEYLLTLINDILDLSKIEAGKIEIYTTDFNFNNFIQGLTELFQMRSLQKGIAFNYEPLSHLPLGIRTDEKRLRQILINLLGNAIKFTEKGGVDLKIGYDGEEKIRFQVEDTGIGIAPEELEKIFLPFQQVGDPDYQAEGTGLGLSITKKLVEMMGGELRVESQLGHGSTFWFTLNLPDVSNLIKVKKTEQPVVVGFEGPSRKILVVDDKWENRLVLVNLLKPLGFEMVEAKNGQEYLEKAKQNCPDLILTDLVMPVMDGFEATRQLRKLSACQAVKIIATSASVFDSDQKESLEAGCDDFMNKPIHVEELLEKLKIHLELTWIYEQDVSDNSSHQTTEEPSEDLESEGEIEFVGPSPEQATILFDLAMMGDIAEIMEEVDKLEQADNKLRPFCQKIRELAKAFDEEQICQLVEPYKAQS